MKLIIGLTLLTCCLAAPVTESERPVDLSEMHLELAPEVGDQPIVGILRFEDLDPATRGAISDFVQAPFRTATTTPDGKPLYAVQQGPFPLLTRPFVFLYPFNSVLELTTTTTTTTAAPV